MYMLSRYVRLNILKISFNVVVVNAVPSLCCDKINNCWKEYILLSRYAFRCMLGILLN